ncbi:Holliday junction branch migration DNA helicase RuvB [Cyanobacterium stanieri LEGE 03274]|uniref:Holliday junction branch migration complex subunit RuvB n=1 Tax=Cyanobacterium stanieri LEGE 03274 TaxID=1828756 RepID=A0ABR9V7C4_9CHRO|nr:Holliday junction branch migration DNA helicase RuvB [Cyanobacterium stanieri]MBE9223011.1 Holliday junction branch migration DNA helicase RuvB [Cyanobacterium stanieri LEGE 03274]
MAIKRSSSGNNKKERLPLQRQSKFKTPSSEDSEILLPQEIAEDGEQNEDKIRPEKLADYIGQKDLKGVLTIAIAAAKQRQDPLDHILLYGPPGLGKTTMSLILAAEMGVNCKITAAPALERPRDIIGLLVSLQEGDILFIDEIHRLNRVTEELLYPAMEDKRLDITIGKGQSAKIRSIPLKPFTLIGATTKIGALTSPLRDRFGLIQRLQFYQIDELTEIVKRSAQIFDVTIDQKGAQEIARRSRGTPRITNRLLRRVRDFAQVKGCKTVDQTLACEALDLHNVDRLGLDWTDRLVLSTIIEQFNGGPVGLDAIASATGEDAKTIEEVYEPYLLQIGFINRTHRGRIATEKAQEHLLNVGF